MTELPPEWTFETTITNPSGVRVTTVITVPDEAAWPSVQECGDVAQLAVSQTAARVLKAMQEEPPF